MDLNLDELLALGDNRSLLPMLVRQLQSDVGVIPFVGAGLSAPYNLPQWDGLILDLAPDESSRALLRALLDANEYEKAAERLMLLRGARQFQLLFRSKFEKDVDLERKTAVHALARLRRGPMITTNFDQVIESVLAAQGCSIDVIVGEQTARMSEAFQYNSDTLLKIHGDIYDPEHRVLTRSEYDRTYTNWLRVLLKNVATRCLLFLGCSLNSDRPVQVLGELVKEGHVQTRHYALLAWVSDDGARNTRARELAENQSIHVIWYPKGRHEYVRFILEYLADQLPPHWRRNEKQPRRPKCRDIPESRFVLFGRNPEELVEAIQASRIVVVEGHRGVGKTAFALQALRAFMDRDDFGALAWITAQARKEQLLLSHILDTISLAIDFPFKAQTRAEDKEDLLRQELQRKNIRCLLLLDNYEAITDPKINDFLFGPDRLPEQLNVLITSTGRLLMPGVKPFPLDELGRQDAAAMFRDRLSRDGLDQENDTDVDLLHEVVGGNPLAIEWIVGEMREGAQLSRLLAQLRKGKADILTRVFEHSWGQLNADARAVLTALLIFVRPALEETLLAASGLDEDAFHNSVQSLTRLYLLKRLRLHNAPDSQLVGRRYFIHPFTRDYLEGQRDAEVTPVLLLRAAEFYLKYVPQRGGTPEQEESGSIVELNGERENLFGVIDGCWSHDHRQLVVSLLELMARWLFIESHWDDLERYGNRAVEAAVAMGNQHAAARILNEVGRTYSHRSDFAKAHTAFDRAYQLASTTASDRWAMAYVLHHKGEALVRQTRHAEAKTVLAESLAGFEALASVRSTIGVRYRLAMLAFETGDLASARALADRGVDDTVRERWNRLEGFNRRLLGDIATRHAQFAVARFQYKRALELVPRTDMRIQALIELSLARLERDTGNPRDAVQRAGAAAGHFEKLRMPEEAREARQLALTHSESPAARSESFQETDTTENDSG